VLPAKGRYVGRGPERLGPASSQRLDERPSFPISQLLDLCFPGLGYIHIVHVFFVFVMVNIFSYVVIDINFTTAIRSAVIRCPETGHIKDIHTLRRKGCCHMIT